MTCMRGAHTGSCPEDMAVDLVLLKTFLKVAALGNITKAAVVLFVTQSAVSRRIKQLEWYAGQPLLKRSGAFLSPTDAGHMLIDKARRMLAIEQEIIDSLGINEKKQKISFCCTPSLGIDRLSGVLSSFVACNAATVDLNCVFTMPEEALAGIASGHFDLALIDHCDEIDLKGHIVHPLPDDEILFISAPSLGIEKEATTIERIFGERLYLKNEKGCAKRFIDKNLWKLGHTCSDFSSIVYFDDFSFITREVLSGQGITFLSSGMVAGELQSGRLRAHHVSRFDRYRPRSLVLARQELSSHLLLFIDTIFATFNMTRPEISFSPERRR